MSFKNLRAELFNPQNETNKSTDGIVLDLEFKAVTSLLSELRDKHKSTVEYLSSADGRFSFLNTSDEDYRATLGKIGNNDNTEHPFGAFTWSLQKHGTIRLYHAGGMAQAHVNGDFDRGHKNDHWEESIQEAEY